MAIGDKVQVFDKLYPYCSHYSPKIRYKQWLNHGFCLKNKIDHVVNYKKRT